MSKPNIEVVLPRRFERLLGKRRMQAIDQLVGSTIAKGHLRVNCVTWQDNQGRAAMLEVYVNGRITDKVGLCVREWETSHISTAEWLNAFVVDVRKAWTKKGWLGQ